MEDKGAILSIQSHVAYGYVGNKAAVFPLQSLGFDVWPIHTVQFSNHTGYGTFTGERFSYEHIKDIIDGIIKLAPLKNLKAVVSGYLGTPLMGHAIKDAVLELKKYNEDLIYLCDPVMGDVGRGIFVDKEIVHFFLNDLKSNIITPNHFEAELLSGFPIKNMDDIKKALRKFHERNIDYVVITSLKIKETPENFLGVLVSDKGCYHIINTPHYSFSIDPNGTGDLFSALFLGFFLIESDANKAIEKAVKVMHEVIKNTHESKKRELQVLSVDYKKFIKSPLFSLSPWGRGLG